MNALASVLLGGQASVRLANSILAALSKAGLPAVPENISNIDLVTFAKVKNAGAKTRLEFVRYCLANGVAMHQSWIRMSKSGDILTSAYAASANDRLPLLGSLVPPPPSDLDTFRAMLERAGVRFVLEPAKGPERRDPLFGDALTIRRAETNGDVDAMVSFVFNQKTGALMSAGIWGDE